MKKNYTHISMVLDKSSSMSHLTKETIESFNKFINEQKNVPGEATFSLVLFDTALTTIYNFQSLNEVVELNDSNYIPGGYTALLDAMGTLIITTGKRLFEMKEHQRPDKVIFVTLTDGEENSSIYYNKEFVKTAIENQQSKYAWQFVFLGANIDAIETARSFNIPVANAMNYAHDAEGTKSVYNKMSSTMAGYRMGYKASMDLTDSKNDK